jgi:hypothetical protein
MVLVVDDDEAIRESIPIVVISADENIALKATGFRGDFLSEPVRLDTVLGLLDRHCV